MVECAATIETMQNTTDATEKHCNHQWTQWKCSKPAGGAVGGTAGLEDQGQLTDHHIITAESKD